MRRLEGGTRWYARQGCGVATAALVIICIVLLGVVATAVLSGLNNEDIRKIKSDLDDDDSGSSSSGSSSSSSGGSGKSYCSIKNPDFEELLFCDTYNGAQGPFNPNNTCPYFYFGDPTLPYVADDGRIVNSYGRSKLIANPYTKTVPQGPGGTLDHTKTLVFTTNALSVGGDQTIRLYSKSSCQTFGVNGNPFPSYLVANAEADMRLASCAINFVDFTLFIVLDFLVTEEDVQCLYERLPFGRATLGNYRAFTSIKSAGGRSNRFDIESLDIEYDRAAGVARWYRDGIEVCNVSDIGTPSSDFRIILDLGGTDEVVDPTGFSPGFGLFTLLDMLDPNNVSSTEGLVRLVSGIPNFYVNPSVFWDEDSLESSRLFGQGASLSMYKFKVVVSEPFTSSDSNWSGHRQRRSVRQFGMSEPSTLSGSPSEWSERFVGRAM